MDKVFLDIFLEIERNSPNSMTKFFSFSERKLDLEFFFINSLIAKPCSTTEKFGYLNL